MKTNINIVTEGKFDAAVLEKLIRQKYGSEITIKTFAGSGFSSALSMVKSLMFFDNDSDLVLVMDTDTNDQKAMMEKQSFVREYIGVTSEHPHVKLVWAIPEFEIIFLTNKKFMNELTTTQIDEITYDIAKNAPKRALARIASSSKPDDYLKLLDNKTIATSFFDAGVVKEIGDFIEA